MPSDSAAEWNVRAGFFVLGLPAWEEDRMAADRSTAELERFLAERADHLLRTAVLLTGSKEAGEDLLQTAVERLLRRWRRFDGDPEGYLPIELDTMAILRGKGYQVVVSRTANTSVTKLTSADVSSGVRSRSAARAST
jgi:hypothetical protein